MELTRPDRPGVLVCDYGGVLTNPLAETYAVFARSTGIGLEPIAAAFAGATARYGISPMAALEVADITEAEFTDRMLAGLPPQAAEVLAGRPFGELWFRGRRTNEEVLALVREVRASGHRVALLTNNVREWGPRWRATVPVDELFDVVVDSSEEGVRKPDPEIYRRLLARLRTPAESCLLLDDTEENTVAAERLGLRTVLFKDPAQAIADVRDALGLTATGGTR
ncbi:HAD family phosphatase [Streptomyces sp. JH002]|uniref:HAD family hydrolase n=1 Tax=Streptomyces sp. JH002 TaxID=2763259 RepID=UPI003D802CAB